MAAGHTAALDRFAALIVETTGLSEDRGTSTFRQANYRLDLADLPDQGCHRTFHVLYGGAAPHPSRGGGYGGSLVDDILTVRVQVAYLEAGGSVNMGTVTAPETADRRGIDRLAAEDLNRLRQRLETPNNPDNRDFDSTGITEIHWDGTERRAPTAGSGKVIFEMAFRVWVRHATVGD